MTRRPESGDEQFVLRQVVSEIRWILAHSGGVRGDLIRLVRRYEDALYGPSLKGRSGDGHTRPAVSRSRIVPFPHRRSSGEPIAASTNTPSDSA